MTRRKRFEVEVIWEDSAWTGRNEDQFHPTPAAIYEILTRHLENRNDGITYKREINGITVKELKETKNA